MQDEFCCGYTDNAYCDTCGSESIDAEEILAKQSARVVQRQTWYRENREQHKADVKNRYYRDVEASRQRIRDYQRKIPRIQKERVRVSVARRAEREPEVVRLNAATRSQKRRARLSAAEVNDFSAQDWLDLLEAYGHCCRYCGIAEADTPEKWLVREHKTPLARGGHHTKANIVPACHRCNSVKHTKTEEEFLLTLSSQKPK